MYPRFCVLTRNKKQQFKLETERFNLTERTSSAYLFTMPEIKISESDESLLFEIPSLS